jgi:murein DD-endopeptidase MepM/ murein hydrolase activator NlpD
MHRCPVRGRRPAATAIAVVAALAVALFLAIVAPAAVALARADPPRHLLTLPIEEGRIVALASIPEPNWHAGHRGLDIAADASAPVLSPGAGRVAFAGTVAGRPVVAVELDIGLRATLEPVVASVEVGSRVPRGAALGVLAPAASHCGAAPCLHWGLKDGERYLDPLDWLEGYGRIVLLPNSSA